MTTGIAGVCAGIVALALVSCSAQRGGNAADPAAPGHAATASKTTAACTYKLAAPPSTLLAPMSRPSVAVAGGKLLAAHQSNQGQLISIRGRLIDPAHPAGDELLLSPADGIYTSVQVIPHGSRFFVAWHKQQPNQAQGRWVGADGALGPITDLPFDGLLGMHLVARDTGLAALYVENRVGRDTLHSVLLDAALKPIGPALAVGDARTFDGLSLAQLVLANGEIWQLAAGTGRTGDTMQVHLVRLGANGDVLGSDEVSNTSVEATRPTLVEVPGGVLIAWLEEAQIGQGPATLWTRKIDASGKPVGPARRVGDAASRWEGLALVSDAGEPLLVTERGRNIRVDANGAVRAESMALPVAVKQFFWLATGAAPSLAWVEERGETGALMFAGLRCEGP